MFISPAFAQAAGGAGPGGDLTAFLPLVLIFAVFYFLLIRPQQKRAKEHRAMIEAVRRGDKIVTAGGIVGKISKVKDDRVEVEIADGVRVEVMKSTIADVLSKPEPAAAANDGGEEKKGGLFGKLKK